MKHDNSGQCAKCKEIIDRFPGFDPRLRTWFETMQLVHPETHTSCAGRNETEQEALYARRASRARWGESAHNYNMALDLFVTLPGSTDIYDENWFYTILKPNIPDWIVWYGAPGSVFYELPHVEIRNWRSYYSLLVGTQTRYVDS